MGTFPVVLAELERIFGNKLCLLEIDKSGFVKKSLAALLAYFSSLDFFVKFSYLAKIQILENEKFESDLEVARLRTSFFNLKICFLNFGTNFRKKILEERNEKREAT